MVISPLPLGEGCKRSEWVRDGLRDRVLTLIDGLGFVQKAPLTPTLSQGERAQGA